MKPINNNLITAINVAKRANISRARFFQLRSNSKGPPVTTCIDGILYYTVADVDTWIESREATVLKHTYDKSPIWFTNRIASMQLAKVLDFIDTMKKISNMSIDTIVHNIYELRIFDTPHLVVYQAWRLQNKAVLKPPVYVAPTIPYKPCKRKRKSIFKN